MMKKYFFIPVLILFSFSSFSQWETMVNYPTNYTIDCVEGNENAVFVATKNGELYKTEDNGITWINVFIDTNYPIEFLEFLPQGIGFVLDNAGQLFYSDDYGSTWSLRSTIALAGSSKVFQMLDSLVGFYSVFGDVSMIGTVDGGISWQEMNNDIRGIKKFYFISESIGWILNNHLLRTNDGALTVDTIPLDGIFASNPTYIHFLDTALGWVVANNGCLYNTSNGGTDWEFITQAGFYNASIYFTDSLNGFYHKKTGPFSFTTDGGFNWSISHAESHIHEMEYISTNYWIVGQGGMIKRSTDLIDWTPLSTSFTLNGYADMFILDETTFGFLDKYTCQLLLTEDGGDSYSGRIATANNEYWANTCLHIISNTNFILGDMVGTIKQSIDGGRTYTEVYSYTQSSTIILDIEFLTSDVGYAAMKKYTQPPAYSILKTIDGGTNWSEFPLAMSNLITDMSFVGLTHGWMCTADGELHMTVDGGNTWSTSIIQADELFWDIQFLDENNGFLFGYQIYSTNDGGNNWIPMSQPHSGYVYYKSGHFINETEGWVLASDGIWFTENGGVNWSHQLSIDPYLYRPEAMKFYGDEFGLMLAWEYDGPTDCVLFKTNNGGVNWIPEHPKEKWMLSNVPNPFHEATTLLISLSEPVSFSIEVRDIQGRLLEVPYSSKFYPAGIHQLQLNTGTWKNGIYFCTISGKEISQTIKLLKMK